MDTQPVGHPLLLRGMSQQQREVLQSLTVAYISSEHQLSSISKVRIWGSVIFGDGIISCPNATTLKIRNRAVVFGDPANLRPGGSVGVLGLNPITKQRVRVTGTVDAQTPSQIVLTIGQACNDCPAALPGRQISIGQVQLPGQEPKRTKSDKHPLDNHSILLIERSATFFLATSSGSKEPTIPATVLGSDMSIRMGPVGFVTVRRHPSVRTSGAYHTLKWADVPENDLFHSFGNIALNPRAGLLFIDWTNGDTLQLTGTVETLYNECGERRGAIPGAARTLELTVQAYVYTYGAVPLSSPAVLMSPPVQFPPGNTGTQSIAASAQLTSPPQSTVVDTIVTCVATRRESPTVMTFEFALPPATQALLQQRPLRAGQNATFLFPVRSGQALTRTWSVSCDPQYVTERGGFCITVKCVGQVSRYLHEHVCPDTEVALCEIGGNFVPDYAAIKRAGGAGVLLIAAGMGITPLYAMLRGFLDHGIHVVLLYSVRESSEAVLWREVQAVCAQYAAQSHRLYLTISRGDVSEMPRHSAEHSPYSSPQGSPHSRGKHPSRSGSRTNSRTRSRSKSRNPSRSPDRDEYASRSTQQRTDSVNSGHHSARVDSYSSNGSPHSQRDGHSRTAKDNSKHAAPYTTYSGRVSAQMLHIVAPDLLDRTVFLCGPESFRTDVTHILVTDLRYPNPEHIYTESFTT
jgi:ferredoxin-NADP reductase